MFFFLISPLNMLWYSLEAPRQALLMSTTIYFFEETRKYISTLWLYKAPYIKLCSTFNIKTIPLIRPLLGSTEDGLNTKDGLNVSMSAGLKGLNRQLIIYFQPFYH